MSDRDEAVNALAHLMHAAHWDVRDAGVHKLGSFNAGREFARALLSPEHAPTVAAALKATGYVDPDLKPAIRDVCEDCRYPWPQHADECGRQGAWIEQTRYVTEWRDGSP